MRRRGFTLLETLLVLGLISMLAAVLVGGSAQLLKGTARSDPEDALMAMLQTLRRQAAEQDRPDGLGREDLHGHAFDLGEFLLVRGRVFRGVLK